MNNTSKVTAEVRSQILTALKSGSTQREVAEQFGISQPTVNRVKLAAEPRASSERQATLDKLDEIDRQWQSLRDMLAKRLPNLAATLSDDEFDMVVDYMVAQRVAEMRSGR